MIKCPIFFIKKGIFGQYGWKRINVIRWLWYHSEYVTKVKWVKFVLFPKAREKIHDYLLHKRARERAREYAEQLERRYQAND